jgi:hypothetical protein
MANKIIFGKTITGFDDYKGRPVTIIPVAGPKNFSAYVYQCWLNVDWDGAHTAYGLDRPDTKDQAFPQQKNLTPLESGARGSLMNARRHSTGDWVGLVAKTRGEAKAILQTNYPNWNTLGDPKVKGSREAAQTSILNQFLDDRKHSDFGSLEDIPGNGKFPIVQLREMGQPHPGYYVSQCNAYDRTPPINLWDQNIYLDAGEVPYSVVPRLRDVSVGDFGLIIRNSTGENTPFLFGDTGMKGGSTRVGECSGYVYETIAGGKFNDETFTFIVFPNSGSGRADPPAVKRMESVVNANIAKLNGADDTLAATFGSGETEYRNINVALRSRGGPEFSGARAHGGPETRAEDFPDR